MALVIKTDEKGLKIWRNDEGQFPRYSYTIGKKQQDGSYINCYQSIRFKKGVEVANGEEIVIDNAFFSFDVDKQDEKKKYPYLFVTEFHKLNDNSFIDVPDGIDEALPFR